MSNQWSDWKIIVIILAVIGAIAMVAFLGMSAMHGSMIGRMSANPIGHSMASMRTVMVRTPHSRYAGHEHQRIWDTRFNCREVVSVVMLTTLTTTAFVTDAR